MEDAVAAAHRAGEEIWRRYGVPVYFYEHAARSPQRRASGKGPKTGNSMVRRPILGIAAPSHGGRIGGGGARVADRL